MNKPEKHFPPHHPASWIQPIERIWGEPARTNYVRTVVWRGRCSRPTALPLKYQVSTHCVLWDADSTPGYQGIVDGTSASISRVLYIQPVALSG
jgi:hypothetical protein